MYCYERGSSLTNEKERVTSTVKDFLILMIYAVLVNTGAAIKGRRECKESSGRKKFLIGTTGPLVRHLFTLLNFTEALFWNLFRSPYKCINHRSLSRLRSITVPDSTRVFCCSVPASRADKRQSLNIWSYHPCGVVPGSFLSYHVGRWYPHR